MWGRWTSNHPQDDKNQIWLEVRKKSRTFSKRHYIYWSHARTVWSKYLVNSTFFSLKCGGFGPVLIFKNVLCTTRNLFYFVTKSRSSITTKQPWSSQIPPIIPKLDDTSNPIPPHFFVDFVMYPKWVLPLPRFSHIWLQIVMNIFH